MTLDFAPTGVRCVLRVPVRRPADFRIREKDGLKLQPKIYYTANANSARVGEAIQGYMRKIGVDWKITALESTIMPAKLTGQDFDLWTVTVPYLSAGELMIFYFDSAQIPVLTSAQVAALRDQYVGIRFTSRNRGWPDAYGHLATLRVAAGARPEPGDGIGGAVCNPQLTADSRQSVKGRQIVVAKALCGGSGNDVQRQLRSGDCVEPKHVVACDIGRKARQRGPGLIDPVLAPGRGRGQLPGRVGRAARFSALGREVEGLAESKTSSVEERQRLPGTARRQGREIRLIVRRRALFQPAAGARQDQETGRNRPLAVAGIRQTLS